MTLAKPSPLSLTLTSILCLAACGDGSGGGSSDESGAGSLDGTDTAEQGTEDGNTSNSTSGDGDGDGDGGSGDGDSGDGDADDSDSGDDSGIKFDLAPIGDAGMGGGIGGPGSCRESEIYGAAGGFPAFEDPSYADFLDRTVAIVTHREHYGGDNHVITIVDISGDPPPPNTNYLAPLYWNPTWNATTVGRVFGLTLDSDGNMYVAPTTVYGANSSPATIKRIDALTGEVSNFATLPNNGPAMGNLNYDCVSETIYVANHEDGRIYQLDTDGNVVSTYHHGTGNVTMGPANDPGEPDGLFAPLGERVWAIQSHAGRLYYSVWWEHSQVSNPDQNNAIWSVAYSDDDGIPDPATAKWEFDVPPVNNTSQPVSDISFAHDGWMLISQRTMYGDSNTSAHQSTTFDYDYENGEWIWQGTNYVVGELLPYSASGGVDHDFDPGGYVWMTGDALDFYTPDVVYGLQGTPYGGGGIETSTIIDLDHEITQQDKTVYGDVELPIPGDVAPVPPPE